MSKICAVLVLLVLFITPDLQAQKNKMKGGGGKNEKVNIKVKTDNVNLKVKTNGKNDKIKVNINDKGGKGDNGNHYGHHKNKTVWFFGPGDIYQVKGKNKRERIVIFDQVCIRLTTNIGFMFGLLGDVRIKLDGRKAKLKPAKYKQIKMDLDLLDNDLKLLEIKKNKIKIRLGKLKG